ncbi:MAG TPA: vitamin K epoxide reductase family protein [Solirubrobacteraceae bacterium]|nr:vitamin K epoxide reductase family protein [Solirubrobacteraceae bacterium]
MSSTTLRRVMLVIAGLAILLTIYLVYVHYSGARPVCSSKGGNTCYQVQTSVWSKVGPLPVSDIGLAGYIAIFLALLAPDRDETRILLVGMTLFGVCFSGYLTYRELFTLHEICEECVASAIMVTLLFIGAVWRFLVTDDLAVPAGPTRTPSDVRS